MRNGFATANRPTTMGWQSVTTLAGPRHLSGRRGSEMHGENGEAEQIDSENGERCEARGSRRRSSSTAIRGSTFMLGVERDVRSDGAVVVNFTDVARPTRLGRLPCEELLLTCPS